MDIVFQNVYKTFGTLFVLRDFSYRFSGPGSYCLTGVSGCGKTTLLNIVAGILPPDSGRVETDDAKVSYVFQDDRLLPWATAEKNIALVSSPETARAWLARLDMAAFAASYPGELSGGMKQKVAIARALAAPSDIFLFDEPFQGLDQENKDKIIPLIREETRGKLCLFVTHDKEDAHRVAEQVFTLTGPPLVFLGQ